MREVGSTLGIPLYVFGPETHMTAICGMALGKRPIPNACNVEFSTANFLLPGGQQQQSDSWRDRHGAYTSDEISGGKCMLTLNCPTFLLLSRNSEFF